MYLMYISRVRIITERVRGTSLQDRNILRIFIFLTIHIGFGFILKDKEK